VSGSSSKPLRERLLRYANVSVIVVLGSVVGVALLLNPDGSSPLGSWSWRGLPCLISKALGVTHCPSCGLTRGFSLIMRGQVRAAQRRNPWSVPFFVTVLLLIGCAAVSRSLNSEKVWYPALGFAALEGVVYLIYWIAGFYAILQGK